MLYIVEHVISVFMSKQLFFFHSSRSRLIHTVLNRTRHNVILFGSMSDPFFKCGNTIKSENNTLCLATVISISHSFKLNYCAQTESTFNFVTMHCDLCVVCVLSIISFFMVLDFKLCRWF